MLHQSVASSSMVLQVLQVLQACSSVSRLLQLGERVLQLVLQL
jgi:hypothetical protein